MQGLGMGWGSSHRQGEGREIEYFIPKPTWGSKSPKYLALKARGGEFQGFLQPEGLEVWNFK